MKIFWFDCETSGLNPRKNGIIQLAYLLEINGELVKQQTLWANCATKEIEDKALEVTGFTRKQIASYPPQSEMYSALLRTFDSVIDRYNKNDKLIAAGYNVAFDVEFLRQLWFDCGDRYFGSYIAHGTIDPAHLFRYLQYIGAAEETITKLTLSDLAELFAVDATEAHDAAADIAMTREIYHRIHSMIKAAHNGKG